MHCAYCACISACTVRWVCNVFYAIPWMSLFVHCVHCLHCRDMLINRIELCLTCLKRIRTDVFIIIKTNTTCVYWMHISCVLGTDLHYARCNSHCIQDYIVLWILYELIEYTKLNLESWLVLNILIPCLWLIRVNFFIVIVIHYQFCQVFFSVSHWIHNQFFYIVYAPKSC